MKVKGNFSFSVKDKLQETKPAESELFQKNVQPFIKEVLNDFKEYQLFCGKLLQVLCILIYLKILYFSL